MYDYEQAAKEAEEHRSDEDEWDTTPIRPTRKRKKPMKVTLSTRVEPDTVSRLEHIAAARGIKVSDLVREALRAYAVAGQLEAPVTEFDWRTEGNRTIDNANEDYVVVG